MKISKSKRQLAQLLIEAGVKQFPEGASWVAQDKDDSSAWFQGNSDAPKRGLGNDYWSGHKHGGVKLSKIIPNWHQTALSRAEFDQIAAESAEQGNPDADGWIEWKDSLQLPDPDELVDVKYANGAFDRGFMAGRHEWNWRGDDGLRIIAYRLHKPEQVEPQYCESVTRSIPELVTAPTLDQLLQDYRNASDFAADKQAEADEAAKMRDERWKAVQARACDLGVHISVELVVDAEMRESELVITDWRDLRIGDVIEYVDGVSAENVGLLGAIIDIDHSYGANKHVKMKFYDVDRCGWPTKWRFIRRP